MIVFFKCCNLCRTGDCKTVHGTSCKNVLAVKCSLDLRFFQRRARKKHEKLLPIFPSQIGTLSKRDDAAVAFDVDVGVVSCQTR